MPRAVKKNPARDNTKQRQYKHQTTDAATVIREAEATMVKQIQSIVLAKRSCSGRIDTVVSCFSGVLESCFCHAPKDSGEVYIFCQCGISDFQIKLELINFRIFHHVNVLHNGILGANHWRPALRQYILGMQAKEMSVHTHQTKRARGPHVPPPIFHNPGLVQSTQERNSRLVARKSTKSPELARLIRESTPETGENDGVVGSPRFEHPDDQASGLLNASMANIAKAFHYEVPPHVKKDVNTIWVCIPSTVQRNREQGDGHPTLLHHDVDLLSLVFLQLSTHTNAVVCSKCMDVGADLPTRVPCDWAVSKSIHTSTPCTCVKAFLEHLKFHIGTGDCVSQSFLVHYLLEKSRPFTTGVCVSMYV